MHLCPSSQGMFSVLRGLRVVFRRCLMWLTEGFRANLMIYDSLELPSNKDIMNYFSEPGICIHLRMKYTLFFFLYFSLLSSLREKSMQKS